MASNVGYCGLTRHTLITVQCNLDYPDLVYPEPRLSGLARDLQIHYHACTEGVTDDLLWVWLQIERWAMDSTGLSWPKTDWSKYFSQHCWPWSYCIGIVYWLGIINQARNIGISVIRTFTYPVWQQSADGQRGPDNRGCTVPDIHVLYMPYSDHACTGTSTCTCTGLGACTSCRPGNAWLFMWS